MKSAVTLCIFVTSIATAKADDTKFVRVEPGTYLRGENDHKAINKIHPYSIHLEEGAGWTESPRHRVELTKPFEIAATEVTVAQFRSFVEATGHVTDAEKKGKAIGFNAAGKKPPYWMESDPKYTWKNPGFEQGENHPVVCVSWKDARAYCEWLSKKERRTFRLPTEAEWEYAARAGTTTYYSWGDKPDGAYVHANVADAALESKHTYTTYYQRSYGLKLEACNDGHAFTAPVGSLKPNPFGIHDVHGNVWEWCQDIWEEKHYGKLLKGVAKEDRETFRVKDPTGPETTEKQEHGDWRVLRGGSWFTGPISARSGMRAFGESSDGMCYAGFRLVREP